MLYFLTDRGRVFSVVVFALCGCVPDGAESSDVDRYRDATSCLSETIGTYEGRTHLELEKQIDGAQAERNCRKQGHAYDVLVTVSHDVEHPPHGIQVDFDAFDGDNPPTMSPVNRTVYLQPGQTFHAN
jgi:hypothetical protein